MFGIESLNVVDDRFVKLVQAGHSVLIGPPVSDVNNSGNPNWMMPTHASRLYISSTSDDDIAEGCGLHVIALVGLNQDLQPITDIIKLQGKQIIKSNIVFRALNFATALAGGTPGSGSKGIITLESKDQVFGRFIENQSTCEVGRYTVPLGYRLLIHDLIINASNSAIIVKDEITLLNAFPVSLGDLCGSIGRITNRRTFLEGGTTYKFRAYSHLDTDKSCYCSFIGLLAKNESWETLKIK